MSEQAAPGEEALVRGIHDAGVRFVLAATGGGSGAIAKLLTVPGGSRSVLAAAVPYSSSALAKFLGARPEQFCAEYTARLMAVAAYEQAARFAATEEPAGGTVAGIGGTASLASDRPKRGAHRIHVAAHTLDFTAVSSLELTKGARSRAEEEELAAQLLLNMTAQACGLPQRVALALQGAEQVVESMTVAPAAWRRLFAGETHVAAGNDAASAGSAAQASAAKGSDRRLIFAGAFHPLHDGHREMAHVAAATCAAGVEWEISITNVAKPTLDYREMELRAAQFPADAALWYTRAPTFVEKARIFPGATFLVGADTIVRIAESRYYGDSTEACSRAIDSIAAAGCRFLVFGRKTADRFETLAELPLPAQLKSICDAVPAAAFRSDISSTALRKAAQRDD